MAIRFDSYDNSIIVDGFEKGIADSPFDGIADEKNVNIISVPGEASVNFATQKATPPTLTNVSVTSADAGADTITFTSNPTLEKGMAVSFAGASLPAGITAATVYWLWPQTATTSTLYSDYEMNNLVNITATGTGTFSTYNFSLTTNGGRTVVPQNSTKDNNGNYYMVDAIGQVWSTYLGQGTSSFWRYMGNKVAAGFSFGNGLVFYQASDGTGYVFVFSVGSIDYTPTTATISWTYQWSFLTGTVGAYSATPSNILHGGSINSDLVSHEALVGQDNVVYFCDGQFIGSFFEKPTKAFSPVDLTTYTPAAKALTLPVIDRANCLEELGVNLLVGGQRNLIYPWDRTSTSFRYPIWLAESVIVKMKTVNTNTFIFVGNRGRIYVTNGSQTQLYKKVPDHISGTVEPYFVWGGVASTKNQLYFGCLVTSNGGSAISQYGGIWGIDMDTKVIRLVNQLSYGTYNGYPTVMIPVLQPVNTAITNPSGTGFYAGWYDGISLVGIDKTVSTPYTSSQALIDSDLIPIGTYERPRNMTRIEYRLTKPMVSGESVVLQTRLDFSQAWSTVLTDSTVGNFSNSAPVNFENAQWLQIRVILNSTTSSPSYTRLREFRVTGLSSSNG